MIRAKGPKRWEIVIYAGRDPDTGKEVRISRIFRGTMKDARQKERDLHREYTVDRDPHPDYTFSELTTRWLKVARHEASTRYQTEQYLKKHVTPKIGHRKIGDIKPADLDGLYLALEETLAPSTVVRIHGIIRAALEDAVRSGWIATNPARRSRPPEIPTVDPKVPDPAVVAKVLAAADAQAPALGVFLRASAATGMRRGEVCALRWSDLDLRRWEVRKSQAIGIGKGSAYVKGTKTGASRTLALDRRTVAMLRVHRWRMLVRTRDVGGLAVDAFVFSPVPDCSSPWRPSSITQQFIALRKDVGVDVTLRSLRHFVATQLIAAGVDLKTVSGRLDHARTSTTTDRYAGWVAASDRAAAGMIGDVLDG